MTFRGFILAMSLLFVFGVSSLFWMPHSAPSEPDTWRPSIHVTDGAWGDCYDYACYWPQKADSCGKREQACEPRTCRSGGPTIWIDGVPYPEPKTYTPARPP